MKHPLRRIRQKRTLARPLPPPPAERAALGRWGEEAAARRLIGEGYVILARNLRRNGHEVDILAEKDGVTVFCEVKTRTAAGADEPFCPRGRIVSARQRRYIRHAAAGYLPADDPSRRVRFDLIEICLSRPEDGEPQVTVSHIEDAFRR